jgi:16S rRNA (uracil1498-N3)-methyltransferase
MSRRFFTPDALDLGEYTLAGAEAHHLHSVCRIEVGEVITLFNGDGREFDAEVVETAKKMTQFTIRGIHTPNRELAQPVWMASALPKGDRLDFLIEKLTELGLSRFVPLVTERSVVRPKESSVEKYERMVIEASKQCGRNKLMQIDPPQTWNQFVQRRDLPATRLILHPSGERSLREELPGECVIAVGPEGGFTAAEANASGWQAVRLGNTILRIETAAIAAATLAAINCGSPS